MLPPESAIDQLGEFQGALLELLAQDLSLETLQQRLHEEPALAPFRDYVQGFEPRMLEVAALLVKKWGKRSAQGGKMTEG
jgi:hypothetical protein